MDALTLERRHAAISRLGAVADQMRQVNQRVLESGQAVAVGPLAQVTRGAWALSICSLEQASAGILPTRMIDQIATPAEGCETPHLQALRLSTLKAAEARLRPGLVEAYPHRVFP